MEQIDRTSAVYIGGSLFVRIPKPLCKLIGIGKGTKFNIYREGNRIVYEQEVKNVAE